MTTRVEGQESGKKLRVDRDTVHTETETGFHTLIVTDTGEEGTAHFQMSLFGIVLPIRFKGSESFARVNANHPQDEIWTGSEFRNVIFEASPKG